MPHYVHAFPICPKLKEKLRKKGFSCSTDFAGLKVQDLVQDVKGLRIEDAALVLDVVRKFSDVRSISTAKNAWSIYEALSKAPSHVTTFSRAIDDMFDGGIPLGSITEICGAPGVGKTQLCVQLSVNALIPRAFDGAGGHIDVSSKRLGTSHVVVLDTEGSFVPNRVFEMASSMVAHFRSIADTLDPVLDADVVQAATLMDAEALCDRILVCRCTSLQHLLAAVKRLSALSSEKSIALVIVDSLAMHFRHDVDDFALRARLLGSLVQDLSKLASTKSEGCPGIAVVLTNQMTTKIYGDHLKKSSRLIPALGDSWAHAPTHRLLLHWGRDGNSGDVRPRRLATLIKSPSRPEVTVSYRVTSHGIRDDVVKNSNANLVDSESDQGVTCAPSAKRKRLS